MSAPRILVAGIGNIFQGDDAFGVEVAQRMLQRRPDCGVDFSLRGTLGPGVADPDPVRGAAHESVSVADFGIRCYDLAFALMDDCDTAILVDATQRGGEPGTLYTIEPEIDDVKPVDMSGHSLEPATVLRMVRTLGGQPKRVLVVGCEPAALGGDQGTIGLSPAVEAAIEPAIAMIDSLIARLRNEEGKTLCA